MGCFDDVEDREKSNRILWGAFAVFTVATLLFVSYVGVDHHWERQHLEKEIEKMEDQLLKLSASLSDTYSATSTDLRNEIRRMIKKKRSCDRDFAIIEQMQKFMSRGKSRSEKSLGELEMWDNMPKPFLHLTAGRLSTRIETGNVDKMRTVTGWEITGGGECDSSDLRLHEESIIIPFYGNYSVYTHITFICPTEPTRQLPTIHRHAVQFIETNADFRDVPKILMENGYQLCGDGDAGKRKTSRQGGVYRFTEGDILTVLVSKHPQTLLGSDAMFSVHLV